ncbi:unnamed protein product [Cuscuta europaea]|uniref:FAR1 domain-containing protein n=1 Tax=Cuscuta europaea TaxID=41803 RepID=A0A9P1E184_CUSEU|nr:unnamed protein product [Cuscuta europaea]
MNFDGVLDITICDTTANGFWAEWDQMTGASQGEGQISVRDKVDGETAAAMDDVPELDEEIQQNESEVGSIKAPDVGMEFDSKEAVYDFYKTYGKRLEFPIRIGSTMKHKNGVHIVGVLLECSCPGSRSSKSKIN